MKKIARLIPLLALPLAPSAGAQTIANPIVAFTNKPEHRQIVNTTAIEAFKRLQQCDTATVQSVASPEFYANFGPLNVDSKGDLSAGLIKESIAVSGCGKQGIENILTLSDKGQLKSVAGLPGTSKADPVLAKDSMQYAYMGVMRKIGQCKDVHVIDTKFDDFTGAPNPRAKFQKNGGRPWKETWTLNACGMIVDTDITYIPDETGTGISAAVQKP